MTSTEIHGPGPTAASSQTASAQGADAPSQLVRRRGCFGTIISGGCGCTAFLAGAALAIAVAAPQLLSGQAADVLESHLESRIEGDVNIYDLELHWTEFQRARRVTVHTLGDGAGGDSEEGDDAGRGDSVAEFSLRFPSLLDLLTEPSAEWNFKVTDGKFTARVDEDGTSDLGRCLGLGPADGCSEIVALLGALGDVTRTAGDDDDADLDQRSVTTVVNTSSIQFIDMASGTGTDREEATLSGFFMTARKSRVGFQVEVKEALVEHSVDQTAQLSLALNFGGSGESRVGGAAQLRSGQLKADPIPLSTLRLLGIAPRQGGTAGDQRGGPGFGGQADAVDFYGPIGATLVDGVERFFEKGASLDVAYGPSEGEADGPRQLAIDVAGDYGEFHVSATHDGQWLVGTRKGNGEAALTGGFRLAGGALGSAIEMLAPPAGIEVRDEARNANWYLQSDRFQIPLSARDLSAWSFFGGAAAEAAGAGVGNVPERLRARGADWSRAVARAMRRSEAEIKLYSQGVNAAKLVLIPSHPDYQRAYDRLDWTHKLTNLTLSGELGASISSRWKVGQSAIASAVLDLTVPGAALTPGDDLVPRLNVELPAVSVSLVKAATLLPDELAFLLPKRFDRLDLQGLALPQLLAVRGTPRRPQDAPIRVSATMDTTDLVEGTYERGTMTIPRATLLAPLGSDFCERVIKGYMPWFDAVEPRGDGSLKFELRDYSFSMGGEEFKQNGEVILRSDPLRVRLLPEIARKLRASESERVGQDDDGSGLMAWTPLPTRLTLDGLRVGYTGVELPLSDDYVARLDGSFYRGDGNFSLNGLVESHFIQGPEGDDALWMIAINGTATKDGATAQVTFDPGTIDPKAITDLMRRATELGDK